MYGNQTAVNAVDLHVKRGQIYGLLGRNGAGKTTIMKMVLGWHSRDADAAFNDGADRGLAWNYP